MRWTMNIWGAGLCALLASSVAAFHPEAAAQTGVKPAELVMVKDGVFTVKEGSSVNITSRPVILTYVVRSRYSKWAELTLNGAIIGGATARHTQIGYRVNLKSFRSTRKFFADKGVCIVDFLQLLKGGKEAKFRVFCE
ncbi:MAG: hypothetical protein MRY74_04880 [Neomegalonema sp.]|nr:hypothetical protein [Neomegalonema sp.]